ncbi:MAG: hypothetical protein RLZ25_1035 [Pseudomonadota bacterium]
MPNTSNFESRVLLWFDVHGRKDLPWQSPRDPYRVWVSEIMLQQTQVATVIDYFHRFMSRFPSLHALAESELDAVLALWAGLGYYARARNLHRTAGLLVSDYQASFPHSREALEKLPGIGRSTAGAILSLGLGIWAPILDGNVRRVLARHEAIEGWPGQAETLRRLWDLSESLTPKGQAAEFNQAMMDLGSLICTPRNPSCSACPLNGTCRAHQEKSQALYPGRKPSKTIPVRTRFWLVLRKPSGQVYLEQRPEQGIWGGLLSPPEFETREALEAFADAYFGLNRSDTLMPQRRHTFSHFHLDFCAVLSDIGEVDVPLALKGCFVDPNRAERLPAPVRKLLSDLSPKPLASPPNPYQLS